MSQFSFDSGCSFIFKFPNILGVSANFYHLGSMWSSVMVKKVDSKIQSKQLQFGNIL